MRQKEPRPVTALRDRAGRARDTKELRRAFNPPNNELPSNRQEQHNGRRQQNRKFSAFRVVVGFLRILLVAETGPESGWVLLDNYSLTDETDRWLLRALAEIKRTGAIGVTLAPTVFSTNGATDEEAKAAMARLASRGLPTSNQIDDRFDERADGLPRRRRSSRRQR
jgi:hypothetical protein